MCAAMKVLLVQPDLPSELIGWGDLGAIAEPLALGYLSAAAKLDGHAPRLLDLRLHPGTLRETLETYRPDVVGVTGYSMHVLRNLAICREIRSVLPEAITVVGGHHATLLAEDFFEPEIDFVVEGEGTGPFRAILSALSRSERRPQIAAVWTRGADDTFVFGGPAPPFAVDDIPTPDREVAQADRSSYYIDWMWPIALMRNSVGCPFRCSFCSLWKIMDGHYHKRSIEQVVNELAAIEEEYVFLVDDEAFIDTKHMLQLARAIKAAGIRKKYFTYCRIDTLIRFRDMLEEWHELGLERLFIGIESVSDDELSTFNKRLRVAQVEDGLRVAREIGISVFAGFIVSPDFTERSFSRLVRFIEHNKIDYPSFTILTPLPGTEALETFDAVTELQPNGRPNWELFDLQHPVTETRLPKEQFMRHYRDLQKTFAASLGEHRDIRAMIKSRTERRHAV